MTRVCSITGRRTVRGNNVSHANNKTRRKYMPNIKAKRIYVPSLDKFVKIKVSSKGLKIINKLGVDSAIKKYKAIVK